MTQPLPLATRLNEGSGCTSDHIQAEILATLGFIPSFFTPALSNPQVFQHLWQQTLSAYLHNPLPALFKEKLSAYLSRFCAIPYCMICHSCSLYGLGWRSRQVLELLEAPPPTETDLEAALRILAAQPDLPADLTSLDPVVESSLLACAVFSALQSEQNDRCRSRLHRFLGEENYHHLVAFIAYVKTCHIWMESNPDIAYQDDHRVKTYFQDLIGEDPELADFFINYWDRVRRDRQNWAEHQAELAERRRNESTLQKVAEENLYLARAIASTSEGVLITDPHQPHNPIIYANPAFLRITGYDLAEVMGKNCRFLQGENTDYQVVEQIRQAIQDQREVTATLVNYRKNGQPFWNELRIAPVFSESKDLLYFVGIQTDITERKQAEEALWQSELTLRSFFNSASMMMGIVELHDQDILHISDNLAAASLFGMTPEAMQHRLASDLGVPQEYIQKWLHYYRAAEQSQHPVRFEYLHKTDRGGIWLSATVSAIAREPNHPTRFAYVVEDITDRKQAELALEQQAEILQKQAQLLELASDAILVRDGSNRITFWNRSAEILYGWTKEQAIGQDSHTLLSTRFNQPLELIETELMQHNHWQGELTHTSKTENSITVSSRWALQRDQEGTPLAIMEINSDITDKKALEAQFLRAQRMESIGTLAGGIAHDLNNILTPILSSAQLLLLQTDPTDQKRYQLLEMIESNVRRGAALIKQVLTFARGVEGERTVLQMRHLISEIRQIVQETFPKSIELRLDLANDLWLVSGDATQLHQVLMNFCVNARDAMPNGGILSVSARNIKIDEQYARMHLDAQVGSYILVTVADTGTGIAPDVLDRIFEPFFTTKELGKGTGLGLSTVMAIVKSHGGFVEVSSTPRKGTQFQVYLPAAQTTETLPAGEEELSGGNGELILVVDDEATIRETNRASLEAFNYRAMTASDGIEAIALYAEHKQDIHLVMIDLMMPSMDGAMAIRALRKINSQVKIIAVSGLFSGGQIPPAVSSEIQAFLPKPYTAKDLVKCVNSALKNS